MVSKNLEIESSMTTIGEGSIASSKLLQIEKDSSEEMLSSWFVSLLIKHSDVFEFLLEEVSKRRKNLDLDQGFSDEYLRAWPVVILSTLQQYLYFQESGNVDFLEKVVSAKGEVGIDEVIQVTNKAASKEIEIEKLFSELDNLFSEIKNHSILLDSLLTKLVNKEISSYSNVERNKVMAVMAVATLINRSKMDLFNFSKRPIIDLGSSLGVSLHAAMEWVISDEGMDLLSRVLGRIVLKTEVEAIFENQIISVDLLPRSYLYPWAIFSAWPTESGLAQREELIKNYEKFGDKINHRTLDMTSIMDMSEILKNAGVLVASFSTISLEGTENSSAQYPFSIPERIQNDSDYHRFLRMVLSNIHEDAVLLEVGRELSGSEEYSEHIYVPWKQISNLNTHTSSLLRYNYLFNRIPNFMGEKELKKIDPKEMFSFSLERNQSSFSLNRKVEDDRRKMIQSTRGYREPWMGGF